MAPARSPVLSALPAPVVSTFARAALLGSAFTTDELLVVSGADEDQTYRDLDVALSALVVERTELGHRLARTVRDAAPGSRRDHSRPREIAAALAETNAAPGRVGQFLAAGLAERAVRYAVRAVETAGALGPTETLSA